MKRKDLIRKNARRVKAKRGRQEGKLLIAQALAGEQSKVVDWWAYLPSLNFYNLAEPFHMLR